MMRWRQLFFGALPFFGTGITFSRNRDGQEGVLLPFLKTRERVRVQTPTTKVLCENQRHCRG
jgi:hypothetical protein